MHTLTHESSRVCLDIPRPTFTARRNEITLYADIAPHTSSALSPTRTMSSSISWFFLYFGIHAHIHTHTHAFLAHTHTHSLSHTFAYSHLHVHACVYVGTWKNQRAHPERTSWIGDEESPFAIVSVAPLSLYVTSRGLPSFIIILAVIVIDNGPDATKDFCVPALFRCSNSTHRAPQPRAGSW